MRPRFILRATVGYAGTANWAASSISHSTAILAALRRAVTRYALRLRVSDTASVCPCEEGCRPIEGAAPLGIHVLTVGPSLDRLRQRLQELPHLLIIEVEGLLTHMLVWRHF